LQQAAAAQGASGARPADNAAFLGLTETDLTAPVQAALTTLLSEIEELRVEVGRLKARLNEAEDLADKDSLTPLLNRRAFLRELHRVLTFAQRYGGPTRPAISPSRRWPSACRPRCANPTSLAASAATSSG
jgi:hypothetical protein